METAQNAVREIAELQRFAAHTESDAARLLAVEMIRERTSHTDSAICLWNHNPKMPFGKYAGRRIKSVPKDYLRWLADKPDLSDDLRGPIVALLESYRGKKGGAK